MVEENPNSDGNFFMLNPWHVVMKLIDYADPDAQVDVLATVVTWISGGVGGGLSNNTTY